MKYFQESERGYRSLTYYYCVQGNFKDGTTATLLKIAAGEKQAKKAYEAMAGFVKG